MTNQQHPITPPPELVQQWMREAHDQPPGPDVRVIATQAARWGSDQELEACAECGGPCSQGARYCDCEELWLQTSTTRTPPPLEP